VLLCCLKTLISLEQQSRLAHLAVLEVQRSVELAGKAVVVEYDFFMKATVLLFLAA
jgi:hypothetical protein